MRFFRSFRSSARIVGVVTVTVMLSLAVFVAPKLAPGVEVMGVQVGGSGQCALIQVAFCETFDQPAGTGNRSGQLNGTLWGVSRATGFVNFGQGQDDAWSATQLVRCDGTTPTVQPDNDIVVCNGQVREAVNDNTGVTTLAMYPKQPFDFAGRTGTITFDVSNDTQGVHTVWPELWITDQPVPAPFTHFNSWLAAPRNGIGIRFAASTLPFQGQAIAPACPSDNHPRWSVDSTVVSRNYVIDDQAWTGSIKAQMLDCVIGSSGPGNMNHVEVHISQSQIDVYATDAGTMAPLHHIATIPNVNLTFTRGLVWLEDAHYNADKFGQHNQMQHTFAWDNVGFDGPVLPRDLAFDAPDALVPVPASGQINLGVQTQPNSGPPLTIPNVTGIQNASAGLLTFNFFHYTPPQSLTYVVNGHTHSLAWPYPETTGGTWRTIAAPVPLSEVVAGTNTVSIFAPDQPLAIANVDLVLVGAGGAPVVTPTALPTQTAVPLTSTPVVPSTPTATAQTCTVNVMLNGQQTTVSRPTVFCTNQ